VRRAQRDRFHGRWQYLFIESICNDEAVLEQNYRYKMMYSPDYTEQDSEAVRARPVAPPAQPAPHGTSAVGEQRVSRMLTRRRAGPPVRPCTSGRRERTPETTTLRLHLSSTLRRCTCAPAWPRMQAS